MCEKHQLTYYFCYCWCWIRGMCAVLGNLRNAQRGNMHRQSNTARSTLSISQNYMENFPPRHRYNKLTNQPQRLSSSN